MVSTAYAEAASLAGKPLLGLVLSCSEHVTLMPYQVGVRVRYPKLVPPAREGLAHLDASSLKERPCVVLFFLSFVMLQEVRRSATSLVKVMCVPYTGLAAVLHRGKRKVETSWVSLLGDKCWAGSLLVWFPASWMPLVVETIQAKNVAALTHQDTVVPYASQIPTNIEWQTEKVP